MTEVNSIVDALQSTSMLVRISSSFLGATRTDKEAAREITDDKNAAAGSAKVTVNRLAGADQLDKQIRANFANTRNALEALTTPFGDDRGWRILPNTQFNRALLVLSRGQKQHLALCATLKEEAPKIIEEARKNIGNFNVDLPTVEELVHGYDMKWDFRPIPDSKFKGLPEDAQAKLGARMNKQIADAYAKAKEDVLQRFIKPLEEFVKGMEKYDKREAGRTGSFADTKVTNIKALHEMLSAWNIDGDARLTELSNMVASLASTDPKDLRSNSVVRTAATARARETLDALDAWLHPEKYQQAAQ